MKKTLFAIATLLMSVSAWGQGASWCQSYPCKIPFSITGNGTFLAGTVVPPEATVLNVKVNGTGVSSTFTVQIQTNNNGGAYGNCGSSVSVAANASATAVCTLTSSSASAFQVVVSGGSGTAIGAVTAQSTLLSSNALQKFQQIVVSGSPATVTFSGIPAGYSALELVATGAGSDASTNALINCQFNGDTTSGNYGGAIMQGGSAAPSSSSLSGAASGTLCIVLAGSTAWSGASGTDILYLPGYTNTTTNKAFSSTMTYPASGVFPATTVAQIGGFWKGTSAITSLVLTDTGGNFAAGTTLTLFLVL